MYIFYMMWWEINVQLHAKMADRKISFKKNCFIYVLTGILKNLPVTLHILHFQIYMYDKNTPDKVFLVYRHMTRKKKKIT